MTSSTPVWALLPATPASEWPVIDQLPTWMIDTRNDVDAALPFRHPGVLDATGGFVSHRIVIDFDVDDERASTLRLRFSVDRGPSPDLEIVLDSTHRGVFHPRVVRDDRGETGEPGPTAGTVCMEVLFPAAWLPVGEHTLAISTVIDEAAALGDVTNSIHDVARCLSEDLPPARSHYGDWFGAYLRWQSAELTIDEASVAVDAVVVRPTPLFVRTDDGEAELVDCEITREAGAGVPARVLLSWGSRSTVVPTFPSDRDFGMFRWRFPAPGLDEVSSVSIETDGVQRLQSIRPCRRWTLHLIPHVHLDLGFTDSQGKVLELHCRNIDRALDRMDEDPGFRFAVDGSVIVQEYSRTRSSQQVERLYAAITRGALGVNAFHSNFLTGIVGLDELRHSLDFAGTLPVSESTGMRYANVTDVPTYSRSIPSVLAQHGVGGFVGMSNHGRGATATSDRLHLMSPVRWQGPDGQEILAHFADHYSQLRFIAADPQSLVGATDGLPRYVSRFDRDDYLPHDLAVIGTHADNEDLGDGDTGFVDRWNAAFAWPRLRVSTFDEYLASVAPLTDRLPVWTGETGVYWEDGIGSAAADFARYRRAQALLPASETLGALVAAADSRIRSNRTEYDRAWNDLSIGAEHTLTWARAASHPHASPVLDQFGWKRRFIDDAHRVALDESRRHLAQLAEVLGLVGPGILVVNPHAWEAELETEIDLADGIEVRDAAGGLPIETLASCAGMRRVRVPLGRMAAHGWRYLPLSANLTTLPGGEAAPGGSDTGDDFDGDGFVVNGALETEDWIVELDVSTSLPRRLFHRPTGREVVDPESRFRLGQIIRAAEEPFSLDEADQLKHPHDFHGHTRRRTVTIENFNNVENQAPSNLIEESPSVTFSGVRTTFDGLRLRWRGSGAGIEHVVVDLLLRNGTSTVDLDLRFEKSACIDMEAVYVAFPFGGTNPRVRYDRPLGWVEPRHDHGSGASNEWAAASTAVSVSTDEGHLLWTPLDTPLFTVGDIVRGQWPTHYPSDQAGILSYALNNFWPCNVPVSQPGPVTLSYRFGLDDGFQPARAGRFGRTARTSALAAEILPLDRYRPSEQAIYQDGVLGSFDAGDVLDIHLVEGRDEGTARVDLVNLGSEPIEWSPNVPAGYAPRIHAPVIIPGNGFGHVDITRLTDAGRPGSGS